MEEKNKNDLPEKTTTEVDEELLYSSYDGKSDKRKNKRNWITILLFCVFLGVFIYAATNIIIEQVNNSTTSSVVEELKKSRLEYQGAIERGETSETTSSLLDPDIDYTDPVSGKTEHGSTSGKTSEIVLDEIGDKANFLIADLTTCYRLNSDTRAWFKFEDIKNDVNGLPIDLPVLRCPPGDRNDFYLNHNFSKEYNVNGWVFFDYRTNTDDIMKNRNIILFGHARSDNMFGGLKYLNENPKWYNNKDNHFIYLKTENADMIWQIFSWYETEVDAEERSIYNYIRTDFRDDDVFVAFCNVLQNKNQIGTFSKFEFDADDHILTLSTCKTYNKNIRVVVHAKLVKLRLWS